MSQVSQSDTTHQPTGQNLSSHTSGHVTDKVSHAVELDKSQVSPRDSANSSIDFNDPRTRLMIEKLLVAVTQDNATSEEKPSHHFNFASYMAVLMRRWFPMLLTFVVTLAVVAWKLKPGIPVYSATATMLLPPPVSRATSSEDPLKAGFTSEAMGNSTATRIALVTSPALVQQALQKIDHQLRTRGWGAPNVTNVRVSANAPVSPDLIDVTATAHDPQAAVALANALIDSYAQRVKQMVRESYKDSIAMLGEQRVQAEKLLLAAKNDLQAYKQRTGILDMDTRLSGSAALIQELEKEALVARHEVDSGTASNTIQNDSGVTELKQKVFTARARYEATLRDFLPDAPEARQARQELSEAQQLLSQRIAALQRGSQERARSAQSRLAEARRNAASLPTAEFQLSQLQSKVKLLQTTYETLSDRYTAVTLARFDKVDTATTLNEASKATPVGRTWTQAIIMALLCALILALLVGVVLEYLDSTVHSAEELEDMLNTTVLGSLPLTDRVVKRPLSALLHEQNGNLALSSDSSVNDSSAGNHNGNQNGHGAMVISPEAATPFDGAHPTEDQWGERQVQEGSFVDGFDEASRMLLEACRVVRSNLTFATVNAPLQSLLITSSDSGEGKSFCALNLATVMAYDGKRVILLDCDLRRPSQHVLSKLPLRPGFSNVVVGATTIDEALRPTPVKNLMIMTAGSVPPNPPELLGSVPSREVIAELKERCDLLIIDSPPVLSLSDAQVLSPITDGVLMVVAAGSTPIHHIQRAQSNILHAGGRLLGVLFNKVRRHSDPYYGSNYAYNYGRETDEQE